MPAGPERSKSEAADCAAAEAAGRVRWETHETPCVNPALFKRPRRGVRRAAALALLGFYAVVLGLANSSAHAFEDFIRLWPWLAALTTGFAVQVGLFTLRVRRVGVRVRVGASSGHTASRSWGSGWR